MIKNISTDAKAGGLLVLNQGNHSDQGNPHSQYVSKQDLIDIALVTNLDNAYVKFCTISIVDRDTSAYLRFAVYNSNHYLQDIIYGAFIVKIQVAGDLASGQKTIQIAATESEGIDPRNIIAVIRENSATAYTIELYVKHWATYTTLRVQPLLQRLTYNNDTGYPAKYRASVVYDSNQPALNALPDGTQVIPRNHFHIADDMRYSIPTQPSANNNVKLFDIVLGANGNKSAIVELTSADAGDTGYYFRALVRVKCNWPASGGTSVYPKILILDSNESFFKTHLFGIITQNDENGVKIGIFLTTPRIERYEFVIRSENVDVKGAIVVPNTFEWQSELPSGPAVAAEGQRFLYLGTGAFLKGITNNVTLSGASLNIGGNWNGDHLIMGVYHIWVGGDGKMRIKNSAPTSDGDGTIIGAVTQQFQDATQGGD